MDIISKKGASLVEVIVAVAILGVILVPISLVFTTAYSNIIGQSDKVAAQQSARAVLYGKGMSSYGVMGDLERSNAASEDILIDDLIDSTINPSKGRSISITEYITDATGAACVVVHKYSFNGSELMYSDSGSPVDYFYKETLSNGNVIKEKSSNGSEVKVTNFIVEKIKKSSDLEPDTDLDKGTLIDSDLIKITVTVTCGRSGEITLHSSYRVPDFERP